MAMPPFDDNRLPVDVPPAQPQGEEASPAAGRPVQVIRLAVDEEQRQFREHLLAVLHRIATAIEMRERR
jgi:hypothetical protein